MIIKAKERSFHATMIILLFIMSITALGAGYGFMRDPSGRALGFSPDYIRFSPFADFFWPGLILFVSIGLFSMVCFFAVLFRYVHYPFFVLVQGLVLSGWIVIQMFMVRSVNMLHAFCLVTGLVLIITAKVVKGSDR